MRHTNAGLSRRAILALAAALLGVLVFVVAVSAQPAAPLAPDVPNGAHCFYGTATTQRGIPLSGMPVVARAVSGYWTGQLSTISDSQGRYGWDGKFCIPGYDSVTGTGAKEGDQIAFAVSGVAAVLYDVKTGTSSSTYPFKYFGNTELNLVIVWQQTITASAGPHGTISPVGAVKVDYGTNQTFTFTPESGYEIDQVLVDDVPNAEAKAAGTYTFTNVRSTHTIHVTFIKSYYTITATAGEGCTIAPSGAQVVRLYDSITFNIWAQTGYAVKDVSVDGASQGAKTSYTFSNVTADHTISATCERLKFTVTPKAGAHGTITPATPQTVEYGNSVTFTITPDQTYKILDVLIDGVSNPGAVAAGRYTFSNVTANHTIEAKFTIQQFVITPAAGAHGTITPATPQIVDYGGSVTFTFSPEQNYNIVDVLIDGVSNPGAVAAGSYTFSNVTANHNITVVFTADVFVITPTAGAHGKITPATPQTVSYGGSVTFTITPDQGYKILDVLIDGVSNPGAVAAGSYTFSSVTAHHTIEAKFAFDKGLYRMFLPLVAG